LLETAYDRNLVQFGENVQRQVSFICNCCGCCCEAMTVERGKLQNLIFDNHALTSHRAMAAILGVIHKLPPARQIMASDQVRSKYLVALINRFN
jgi:hypothetical protein